MSIQSCDVGSLPHLGDLPWSLELRPQLEHNNQDTTQSFENLIVDAFTDKLKAGIQVAAFPQFRDMHDMFLSTFSGVKKMEGRFMEVDTLSLKPGCSELPEVIAIKKNAKRIAASTGNPFQLRLCITGPYTLASFFPYRSSQIYTQLGFLLSHIIESNVFATKRGRVTLVSVDEPLFGLLDDPSIDTGAEGRETLLKAWTTMTHDIKMNGAQSCIHLHSTSDDLFWEIDSLNIIESHVTDHLYTMKTTKSLLDKKDKRLKASIAKTDFDELIRDSLGAKASDSSLAAVWTELSKGESKAEAFLESPESMKRRLVKTIDKFGEDRVALAGPECGLRGFPTYTSAIKCLSNASLAVTSTSITT